MSSIFEGCVEDLLPSFAESQSGWGLEPVWSRLLGDPSRSIAIHDGVIATHLHPSDHTNGPLYVALKRKRIDAQLELNELRKKYNVKLEFKRLGLFTKRGFRISCIA